MSSDGNSQPDVIDVVTVRPYGKAYEGALTRLTRDKSVKLHECDSTSDAVALIRKLSGAVLLCHSPDDAELAKQITLIKLLAPQTRKKSCRILATTGVKNSSVAQSLTFYGASEALQEPINEKGLLFKLERQVRSLAQFKATLVKQKSVDEVSRPVAKLAMEEASASEKKRGTLDFRSRQQKQEQSAGSAVNKFQTIKVEPIAVQSDFWSTAEIEAKRIRDRWLFRLLGPSPDLGKWMKAPGASVQRGGRGLWQWFPNEPEGRVLYKEKGEWLFRGQRPEFQELEWLFVGADPELYFQEAETKLGSKVMIDPQGNLLVAKDSPSGVALAKIVGESLVNMNKKTLRHLKSADATEEDGGDKKKKRRALGMVGASEERDAEYQVKMVEALTIQPDCWLVLDRKPRRVANRWITKLMGPTPANGRWTSASSSDTIWRWIPLDKAKDPFIKEPGEWIFRGLSPKFQEDVWLFVSDRPHLSFVHEKNPKGSKLSTDDDGHLLVAKDSKQGLAFMPLIEESLRMVFKNEARATEMEEIEDEKKKKREGAEEGESSKSQRAAQSDGEPLSEDKSAEDSSDEQDDAEEAVTKSRKKSRMEDAESDGADPGYDLRTIAAEDERAGMSALRSEDEADERKGKKPRAQSAEGGELDAEPGPEAEKEKQGKELSIELDLEKQGKELSAKRNAEKLGKELSIDLDPEKQGKELSAEAGKAASGNELSIDVEKDAAGKEPSAEAGKAASGKELSIDLQKDAAGKELSTEAKENSSGESSASPEKKKQGEEPSTELEKEKRDLELLGPQESQPIKPEDAIGIRAPHPPGPSLSPLTLAFLMAELVSDRKTDIIHAAKRYAAYVSASCGGLQIELWCKTPNGWSCAMTNEQAKSNHPEAAAATEADATARVISPDVMVCGVLYAGKLCGAIVISAAGAGKVKPEYAQAVARIASGLLFSFSTSATLSTQAAA